METRFAYRKGETIIHDSKFYTWGGYKYTNIESNNTISLCIRQQVL